MKLRVPLDNVRQFAPIAPNGSEIYISQLYGHFQMVTFTVVTTAIKTMQDLAIASVKTAQGLAIASVKNKNGLA